MDNLVNKIDNKDGFATSTYTVKNGQGQVHIDRLYSYTPGFGTTAYRQILKFSLEKNVVNNITVEASGSSHLFYLKMGMMPSNGPISALYHFLSLYQSYKKNFVSDFILLLNNKISNNLPLSADEKDIARCLKIILTIKDDQFDYDLAKNISHSELTERHREINAITISYLWYKLLSSLCIYCEGKEDMRTINTEMMGSTTMIMSPMGLDRWRQDLSGEEEFKPFRQLEHLYQFLQPWQIAKLQTIFV